MSIFNRLFNLYVMGSITEASDRWGLLTTADPHHPESAAGRYIPEHMVTPIIGISDFRSEVGLAQTPVYQL